MSGVTLVRDGQVSGLTLVRVDPLSGKALVTPNARVVSARRPALSGRKCCDARFDAPMETTIRRGSDSCEPSSVADDTFRELHAWKKGMALAAAVYQATEPFPVREHYGLAAQMRRAAVSIPSNIAEGYCQTRSSFSHYLRVALGSHAELVTHVQLAERLQFLPADSGADLRGQLGHLERLIKGLLSSVSQQPRVLGVAHKRLS